MSRTQKIDELLKQYRKTKRPVNPKRIVFNGFEEYDVYNPTAPFDYKGKKIIIGRVEKRCSEISEAIFFEQQKDGTYSEMRLMKRYALQDPFITKIGSQYVFGGTEIFQHPDRPKDLWWRTRFYYGEDLFSLQDLAVGPNGMKDIRLVELQDKSIGVFTRPQGEIGNRGKIGFISINQLTDLSPDIIIEAKLLEQFDDEEWGGVNETVLLDNGLIGVLGHIAKYSQGTIRHYYPMVFTLDPNELKCSPMKIIAMREDFLDGPSKRIDLKDVLFSAGLAIDGDKATLYTGVGDVEVQFVEIDNPFMKLNCPI